jgi:hypothetical protein
MDFSSFDTCQPCSGGRPCIRSVSPQGLARRQHTPDKRRLDSIPNSVRRDTRYSHLRPFPFTVIPCLLCSETLSLTANGMPRSIHYIRSILGNDETKRNRSEQETDSDADSQNLQFVEYFLLPDFWKWSPPPHSLPDGCAHPLPLPFRPPQVRPSLSRHEG